MVNIRVKSGRGMVSAGFCSAHGASRTPRGWQVVGLSQGHVLNPECHLLAGSYKYRGHGT
jgi:hypothetical protein